MKQLLVAIAAGVAAIGLAVDSPAQRMPPEPALVIPPLVVAPGAEIPVSLGRAEVDVVTTGSLARTTLLLTLRNPNDRLLEGTLQFPLQPGQQVTAFALDIDGEMRDAVPVPKQQGRQVFESIERRNVDPALLEQVAGNQFRLRVYPIPARGERRVRLVVDEAMRRDGDTWRLDLPLHVLAGAGDSVLRVATDAGAPEVADAFEVLRFKRTGDAYVAPLPRSAFRPGTGLGLRFPASPSPQAHVALHGDQRYVMAEIPVAASIRARTLPRSVGLLWDASGSGARRDHVGEFRLLDRYFRALGTGRVRLRLLRDVGEDGGSFDIRDGDWSALRKALEAAAYDGASNLSDWTPADGIEEYLLVSDGLQNYGDRAFPALSPRQRLYALASAGARIDGTRLASLAEARGGRLVVWQGRDGLERAARALLEEGVRVSSIEGDGVIDLVAQSRQVDDGILRVAGLLAEPVGRIDVVLDAGGVRQRVEVPVSARLGNRPQAAQTWAAWQVAALAAEPERHRAAIERLGREFSLVTAGTSLLVLDDPADYVRHDIPAPPALQARVAEIRAKQVREREASRSEWLNAVAEAFADRIAWWQRDFPKGAPPATGPRQKTTGAVALAAVDSVAPPPAPPAVPLMAPGTATTSSTTLDTVTVTGSAMADAADAEAAGAAASIHLQPWEPDSPIARRLRDAPAERLYMLYLDERDSHLDSTAFYLDAADLLLQRDRRDEALRVLSNLAELDLENRHVLRVLGYRLMQAKAYPLALQVFRQVLEMAEEEPQSHRDLALALAATGNRQAAIRHLYDVVAKEWDARFAEIALVALNELNQIIATSPQPLDTAFIDRRLLKNMPLDLRVALSWDSDNSDMDLWVTDPNGEKCFYSHTLTYQGGLISDDFTGGYGPEEFILRDAKPGKYKVEAHYFGDRQQIVTGATTLSLRLSTGWGSRRQQDQVVTLRLSGKDESVLIGEFEVK